MTIRILIADDHKILRDGLRTLLAGEPDLAVVGEAENGRQAVAAVQSLAPDVVIMDVAMPELNGIEATRQIKALAPATRIVALSMHADRRYVSEVLKAGASGYLLKSCAYDDLSRAIRAVYANHVFLSPEIAGVVVDSFVRAPAAAEPTAFGVLSPRELEVLQLVAEGRSTKEIAAALFLSPKTVETHRRNLMDKLDLHTVAELARYAVREGLISLG